MGLLYHTNEPTEHLFLQGSLTKKHGKEPAMFVTHNDIPQVSISKVCRVRTAHALNSLDGILARGIGLGGGWGVVVCHECIIAVSGRKFSRDKPLYRLSKRFTQHKVFVVEYRQGG